jgi:D-3-phosphoglycerate dehydrogenase
MVFLVGWCWTLNLNYGYVEISEGRRSMVKTRIVDVSSFDDELWEKMIAGAFDPVRFDLVRAGRGASEDDICELVRDASILMTDPFHFQPVTRRIIEAADSLRLVQCYTIGFDDVDLVAARERGVPVANAAGTLSKPIAEYVITVALYLIKSLDFARSEMSMGNWVQPQMVQGSRVPLELGVLTLGIVGAGGIGREVARLAKGFGTRILYHNRNKLPEEMERELGLEYSSLDDLLESSDVLSISVPLTDETKGMIGAEEIARMKEGAVLVNTARGEVVDYDALAEALKSGRLRGAAVDVFENEPDIWDCPMLGLDNVILTPHSSAGSTESARRCMEKVAENLGRFYEGKPLLNVVN